MSLDAPTGGFSGAPLPGGENRSPENGAGGVGGSGGAGAGGGDGLGRPSRAARWSAIAVGVVVVGLLVVFVRGLGGDDPVSASPLDGKPAPVLAGTTLDGGQMDLGRYRGSWVVVNFFATWCPPCVQEHPELVSFAASHAVEQDRVLVSVVFNDDPAAVEGFFDRQGGDWPVLVDEDGAAAVAWAVTGVPESVLVAPNGVVVGKIKGGVRAADLDGIIDDIERRAEEGA